MRRNRTTRLPGGDGHGRASPNNGASVSIRSEAQHGKHRQSHPLAAPRQRLVLRPGVHYNRRTAPMAARCGYTARSDAVIPPGTSCQPSMSISSWRGVTYNKCTLNHH